MCLANKETIKKGNKALALPSSCSILHGLGGEVSNMHVLLLCLCEGVEWLCGKGAKAEQACPVIVRSMVSSACSTRPGGASGWGACTATLGEGALLSSACSACAASAVASSTVPISQVGVWCSGAQ